MSARAPSSIRAMLDGELAAARNAFDRNDDGWEHLERAHVLSQPWALDHIRVHVAMLRRGWFERDRTEVLGQIVRLAVAGPGSVLHRYPIGNSGRARVPATQPMQIDHDDIRDALIAVGHPVDEP